MDLKRTICTQKKIYLSKENIIGKFIKNYNYLDIDKMSQENIIGKFIKNYNCPDNDKMRGSSRKSVLGIWLMRSTVIRRPKSRYFEKNSRYLPIELVFSFCSIK